MYVFKRGYRFIIRWRTVAPSVYKDKAGVVLNRPEITVSEKMNIAKEHLVLLEPDFKVMENLSRELQVVGVHAFSLTNESELIAVCRNFAPLYGIDEESATGTANCALASYLYRHYEKREQYIFEQGHNLDQISRIVVKIVAEKDEIQEIFVGGYGYLVCEREIGRIIST